MTNKTDSEEMVLIPKWEYEKLKAMQERVEDSELMDIVQDYFDNHKCICEIDNSTQQDAFNWHLIKAIQQYIKG